MKTKFIWYLGSFLALGFCSCANLQKQKITNYRGHVTLAAGGSDFTTLDGKRYLITKNDLPESVYKYLHAQPQHRDIRSESDYSRSCYVEVKGSLIGDKNEEWIRLHAMEVKTILPASEEYKKTRATSALPEIERSRAK